MIRGGPRLLAWLLAGHLLGCTDEVSVAPVIDTPSPNADAYPYPSLDELELIVTLEGSREALTSGVYARGQSLELRGVPYGENLVLHMIGRIGSSEVAYGRTCPFSVRTGEDAPSPHLYFSRTVKWATSETPSEASRRGGLATTYHDGSGMFVGGFGAGATPLTAVDRFDPHVGAFNVVGQLAARRDTKASVLGDGRILIVGGYQPDDQLAGFLELIEVDVEPARRIETFPAAGLAVAGHALSALTDGRVLAFGGRDVSALTNRVTEVSSDAGSVSLRTLAATLAVPRREHVATRVSDALGAPVLITGGLNALDQVVATAELYRPLSESFAPPAQFAPMMVVPRRGHQTARLADDSVLVVGGFDAAGAPVTKLELFSFERGFVDAGDLPVGAGVTGQTLTTLPDRRLLITGGLNTAGVPVSSTYIARVDPVDGSLDLIATDSLSRPRAGHVATLLCDGTVMLVGGTAEPSPAERYNPPDLGRR
ncbi:MAG: hypothetical protein R3B48_01200 [Kofleriaceae bacterium]